MSTLTYNYSFKSNYFLTSFKCCYCDEVTEHKWVDSKPDDYGVYVTTCEKCEEKAVWLYLVDEKISPGITEGTYSMVWPFYEDAFPSMADDIKDLFNSAQLLIKRKSYQAAIILLETAIQKTKDKYQNSEGDLSRISPDNALKTANNLVTKLNLLTSELPLLTKSTD